jgi:hypothetical protein
MENPQQHSKSDTQTFYCMVSRTAARLLSETKQRSLKTSENPTSVCRSQRATERMSDERPKRASRGA